MKVLNEQAAAVYVYIMFEDIATVLCKKNLANIRKEIANVRDTLANIRDMIANVRNALYSRT